MAGIYRGRVGLTATRDVWDILTALTSLKCCVGCWQQEPWAYSDRNTCGFSPPGCLLPRYCGFFFFFCADICTGMYANYCILVWSFRKRHSNTHNTYITYFKYFPTNPSENLWIIYSEQDLLFEDVALAFLIVLCKIPFENGLYFGI